MRSTKTAILAAALVMAGCGTTASKDYQFGDGLTATVNTLEKLDAAVAQYCKTAPNDPGRNAALAAIRGKYPWVPENGICTYLAPAPNGATGGG